MKFKENEMIELEKLEHLYQSVQWSGYTNHRVKMEKMLEGSLWWCACWIDQELTGLIRVVGDGVSIIYVQDILVNPKYQRQGIGSRLFKIMMNRYASTIRQIVLLTDDEQKTHQFYTSLGLKSLDEVHAKGFVHYNFEK
ncbi:GNAT family N-acetyltransferase [Erysipelothrix urinaevulpis]|uniref:GNAT family N-acetyltransferase n=1 Tax=Erysipelothrix urinaevulpis TaxID=2683717 RepID=UPI00135AA47D|nr:GNAT family N-acetyltransferase [Erysipelothrix urinaevulpis]